MPAANDSKLRLFGIRHHGPGCARSLKLALQAYQPDCVLVEGPPDANDVIGVVANENTKPPVALLAYTSDSFSTKVEKGQSKLASKVDAVFYPFSVFSPEWQAILYALNHNIHVSFIDLPRSHMFALASSDIEQADETTEPSDEDEKPSTSIDPVSALAQVAGYDDSELWWDNAIELQNGDVDLFDSIADAMREVRADAGEVSYTESLREAHMRKMIRKAKLSYSKIAVVCGAWHVPALEVLKNGAGPTKEDNALLKGLAKRKVEVTWIPWTNARLSYRSGYGAGIDSPGWYGYLWEYPQDVTARWIALSARLLREEDLDASSASVIEAVRLADTLAALRGLCRPSLKEIRESIRAVLCLGDDAPVELIRTKLEIGYGLGSVPSDVDSVPLQKDFDTIAKRLRLKIEEEEKVVELDLRKPNDVEKSKLYGRLNILGITWAKAEQSRTKDKGTFKEFWRVAWQPEFYIQLIEASVYGYTLEAAASNKLAEVAQGEDLLSLAEYLLQAIRADLSHAVYILLRNLQARAADSSDIVSLMQSLPALSQTARYGDVRGTSQAQVEEVLLGLFERVTVGLPTSCHQLSEEAARQVADGMAATHNVVQILSSEERTQQWHKTLYSILDNDNNQALLRGKSCRLLLNDGVIEEARLMSEVSCSINLVVDPVSASQWLQGLVEGGGLSLINHGYIWAALDDWLANLTSDSFVEILPLLRRAFSDFSGSERRRMGALLKNRSFGAVSNNAQKTDKVDDSRAKLVLPVFGKIIGAAVDA